MAQVVKIYALLLGSALLMFGGGLQGLLMSVRGAEEGFSLIALGLIGTGWSVGFIAGSVSVPMLVRKVGHIRSYAVMAVMGGMTILLNLLWINDVGWIVMRAFSGFCFAGAAMVVESWLNEVSENKTRGTIFALYVTINTAASTLGQLAMSITGTAGYIPFVLGALAFMGAIVPTAVSSTPQPQPLTSAKTRSRASGEDLAGRRLRRLRRRHDQRHLRHAGAGLRLHPRAQRRLDRLSHGARRRGRRRGADSARTAVRHLSTAASSSPRSACCRRWSASVAIIFNPGDGWLLYTLFGLYGLTAFPVYAIAVAHANDYAKEGEFSDHRLGHAADLRRGAGHRPDHGVLHHGSHRAGRHVHRHRHLPSSARRLRLSAHAHARSRCPPRNAHRSSRWCSDGRRRRKPTPSIRAPTRLPEDDATERRTTRVA